MRCWWYQSWPKMKKSNTRNSIEISIKVNIFMKFQWNSIKFPKSQEMSKKFNGNVEIPWLFKKIQLFHFQLENHFTLALILHASPPELNSDTILPNAKVCLHLWAHFFIYFVQIAPMGTFIYIFCPNCAYGHISLYILSKLRLWAHLFIYFVQIAPMGAFLYIFHTDCTYEHTYILPKLRL